MNQKYMQRLIREQFNINDLDFSDDSDSNDVNIFLNNNKTIYEEIYEKLLKTRNITNDDFKKLHEQVAIIRPKDKNELMYVLRLYSKKHYVEQPLNWLNVSDITDMSCLFLDTKYTGDISKWDVSRVTDMKNMFCHSKFNNDISQWDVSHVTDMQNMFSGSSFNHNISKWDVSNVKKHQYMFLNCPIKIKYKPKFRR